MKTSKRMLYVKKLLCTIVILFFASGAFAQVLKPIAQKISEKKAQQTFSKVSLFSISNSSQQRNAELMNVVSDASVMEFSQSEARQIILSKPENISFTIPTNSGINVELELYLVNIFTPDFSVVTSGSNGQAVPYSGGIHYWGIIKGDNTSLAAISIYDREVMGMISSPSIGNLVLGKLENDPLNRHVFYNDRNLNTAPATNCFTANDNGTYSAEDLQDPGARILANCIRLYWEVNFDIYTGKGSVGNAANYVIGLFSQSAIIYTNDAIPVELSQVYVWNTTSPYTSTSTSGLLGQFQSNRNSFNGNLGHLLGYAGGGGVAAGFSGFCSANLDNSQCYSGIQSSYSNVPTYSWSVMVVTHEQGHLMGSRHTHACVWNGNNTAIDNCGPNAGYGYEGTCSGAPTPVGGGTIMSYCHLIGGVGINFSNGFGTQPKNVILNGYGSAACLTACSGSSVVSSISTSNISPSTICAGSAVNVSYALNGAANAGNIFTAQLSNSAGSFSSPVAIGTLSSVNSGTIAAIIPAGTSAGSGYRIRVVGSNPALTGSDNGTNITIAAQVAAAGGINGLTNFCAWLPVQFNVGAIANATTYTWTVPNGGTITNGQGTTQITVAFTNTTSPGNVTVFGSNASCTGAPSSFPISILATPGIPSTSDAVGCSGTAIILTGSPSGGTWSVPNPYSGSSTTFYYTVTNGATGCSASSTFATGLPNNITVNPKPVPSISGNTAFCSGNSIILNAGSGFTNYSWSTGATTQTISVSTANTFIVTVTNANGCTGSTSATTTVNAKPTPSISGSTSFCQGSSTILNAGAGYTSYLWSTSAITQTINISTAGTYTVTVTNANGCTGSTSATITVNALPTVSFSGLASSYFLNDPSVSLTGNPPGGTFSGTGISGNTFNPSSAGVGGPYTITYSYTDGNGCSNFSSQSTTVNQCALPAQPDNITVTGGIAKVCPGEIRTYSTTLVSGITYNWTLPAGGTINSGQGTSSISVTYDNNFTAAGTLFVIGSNVCGNSTPRNLTVNRNNPTATVTTAGPTTFCSGTNPLTLTANAGTGLTYQWKKGASNISGATGQSYIPTSTANAYKVVVTNAPGCSKTSANVAVTVNPLPTATITPQGPTTFCAGGSVVLLANSGTGLTYQWKKGANLLSGATLQNYTATTGGNYRVIVTDANTCSKTSGATVVTVNCKLSDGENEETKFEVFPNPASGEITIEYSTATSENYQLNVLDLSGRVLFDKKGSVTGGTNNIKCDLSAFSKGIYILKFESETKNFEQRIVLQ